MDDIVVIILVGILILMSIILIMGFIFFYNEKSPITQNTVITPRLITTQTNVNSAKSNIINSGQILQLEPLEISTTDKIPFSKVPINFDGVINPYSICLDCYIESICEKTSRTILSCQLNSSNTALPQILILGKPKDSSKSPNTIVISHGSALKGLINSMDKANYTAPTKKWFNIILVVNNNLLTTWFDGTSYYTVNLDSISPTDMSKLPKDRNYFWSWNSHSLASPYLADTMACGSVQVRNVILWNRALTIPEILNLNNK